MGLMPKTGLRTPAENTDPFHEVFDDEFGTDVDNYLDANAADIRQTLSATSRDQLPWYDGTTGEVRWGQFAIITPRYGFGLVCPTPGALAMAGFECLYVDVPTNRPYSGVVTPVVGAIPQTGRDRIVIATFVPGHGFTLIGQINDGAKGAGPAPGIVKNISVNTTLSSYESGYLYVIDQGVVVTLPVPSQDKITYFLKCNGSGSEYFTIDAELGALGFLGPHESAYGQIFAGLKVFGGGGVMRIVMHEPVPGSGDYGWLIRGEACHYQNDAVAAEDWRLDGNATTTSGYVGPTPPATPVDGDLWFNNGAGWNLWLSWVASVSKWLSIESRTLNWGHDSANGVALRGNGIDAPSLSAGVEIPRDACIVGVVARAAGGDATKQFNLISDNGGLRITKHTFSLVLGIYQDLSLDIDLSDGDDIWVHAMPSALPATDIVVSYIIRERYDTGGGGGGG